MVPALDQSAGFPVRLVDGGLYLLSIDTDGILAWHDPLTGTIDARLYLYEDEWVLERNDGQIIKGAYVRYGQ
jgi:hypothetical protein